MSRRSGFRFGSRSLTKGLIVGGTALALLLVLGVGSATYLALRTFLYSQLDQRLAGDVDADHAGFYFSPRFDYRGSRPGGEGAVWAVAFDTAGNQVPPNPGLAARMSLTAHDLAR